MASCTLPVNGHTVKYKKLLGQIGNLVIDLSSELSNMLKASCQGKDKLWACYDKFNTCFEEYKGCQRSLCSFTEFFGTNPDHHNLLIAFNDYIDGIEMLKDYIKVDLASQDIKCDQSMFKIGLAKQELGREKTLLAINRIISKLETTPK